jgi:predicted DCC family thiol-disulfide oxidoreductase YuxK
MIGSTVLFDGFCHLCNGAVDFILRHDSRERFVFASLDSEAALRAARQQGLDLQQVDSIILIDGDGIHTLSDAVIRIARGLGLPWSMAAVGLIVPKKWRDGLYRRVAANRYRWFGRRDACRVPTPSERRRFLPD